MRSNYDKSPFIQVEGQDYACLEGWEAVCRTIAGAVGALKSPRKAVLLECYPGVQDDEVLPKLQAALPGRWILTKDVLLPEEKILRMIYPDVTDDAVFGYITRLEMSDFFDPMKKEALQASDGITYVYGPGAAALF